MVGHTVHVTSMIRLEARLASNRIVQTQGRQHGDFGHLDGNIHFTLIFRIDMTRGGGVEEMKEGHKGVEGMKEGNMYKFYMGRIKDGNLKLVYGNLLIPILYFWFQS